MFLCKTKSIINLSNLAASLSLQYIFLPPSIMNRLLDDDHDNDDDDGYWQYSCLSWCVVFVL